MSLGTRWRAVGDYSAYKDWVRDLRGKSGVYIIRDTDTHEIYYVGESHTNRLYSTLIRHFQYWEERRFTIDRLQCEVKVFLTKPEQAYDLQVVKIGQYNPTYNISDWPYDTEELEDYEEEIPY